MDTTTMTAPVQVPANYSITDLLEDLVRTNPAQELYRIPDGGSWRGMSAGEFRQQALAVARGLIASGINAGDRVGIMSRTRFEWSLVDLAIWYAGAVSVPVYETSSVHQTA